jgi:hypothetical protein
MCECPICKSNKCNINDERTGKDIKEVECEICGKYHISGTAEVSFSNNKKNKFLSYCIFQNNLLGKPILSIYSNSSEEMHKIIEFPIKLQQQIENVLHYFSIKGINELLLDEETCHLFGIDDISKLERFFKYTEAERIFDIVTKLSTGGALIELTSKSIEMIENMVNANIIEQDTKEIEITNNTIKKVFISYCWNQGFHDDFVLDLATKLRSNGVDVILDKWDLKDGHNANFFMEDSITKADKVLILCDKRYSEKSNKRHAGVGIETSIINYSVYKDQKQEKFIPIFLEKENNEFVVPIYLNRIIGKDLSELYLSQNMVSYDKLEDILRTIFEKPIYDKPAIGNPPDFDVKVSNERQNILLKNQLDFETKNMAIVTNKRNQDIESLIKLLSVIYFPTILNFINIDAPRFRSFNIVANYDVLTAYMSDNYIFFYDNELMNKLSNFIQSWSEALSYDEYFKQTSNLLKVKFIESNFENTDEVYNILIEKAEKFQKVVYDFLDYISISYCIDLNTTNKAAYEFLFSK